MKHTLLLEQTPDLVANTMDTIRAQRWSLGWGHLQTSDGAFARNVMPVGGLTEYVNQCNVLSAFFVFVFLVIKYFI